MGTSKRSMRWLGLTLVALTATAARAGDAGDAGRGERVRFVSPKRFEESQTLPPVLYAVYDRRCNWEALRTVREDLVVGDKTLVNVGILVHEIDAPCDGIFADQKIEAGTTFSGRDYEVRPIVR